MATDLEQLKLEVGNNLRAELPNLVPGLTKLAYEEIIQGAVDALPKNLDQLEAGMEKAALTTAQAQAWFNKAMGARSPLIPDAAKGLMRDAFYENVGRVGAGVGVLAAAGATMVGLNKATNAVQRASLHPAFLNALEAAVKSNDKAGEILRGADRQKVLSYGETIFNYAPNVATDVNLLKGILANAVDYGSLDPATIRSLMELEEKKKNLSSWKPADVLAKA